MSHENSKELIFKLSWDIFRKLRKYLEPSVCEKIRKEVEKTLLKMRDETEKALEIPEGMMIVDCGEGFSYIKYQNKKAKTWRGEDDNTEFTSREIGEGKNYYGPSSIDGKPAEEAIEEQNQENKKLNNALDKKPRYTHPGVGNGKTYDSIEEMEKNNKKIVCCERGCCGCAGLT